MFNRRSALLKLSSSDTAQLSETYDAIYELQYKLNINDDYLLSTSKNKDLDAQYEASLLKLLEASSLARDRVITWYLKHTLVELSVTISLLTAKIKFIEYKLGRCGGLDLHQACSLALVNFCNILADMTVLNVKPTERKTMHTISREAGLPIWLSHYRNQICHVPSESPCIAILVPLVVKSLCYIRDSFWNKVIKTEIFDAVRFKAVVDYLTRHSKNDFDLLKDRDTKLSKKKQKLLLLKKRKYSKARIYLRRYLILNPESALDLAIDHLLQNRPQKGQTRNYGALIEQIIQANCLERLIYDLMKRLDENSHPNASIWLKALVFLISFADHKSSRKAMARFNIDYSPKTQRLINLAPLKICQIAFKLTQVESTKVSKMVSMLQAKLMPALGASKFKTLMAITKIAKRPIVTC